MLFFVQENQSSLNFDRACGGLVIQRIIQQMKDYRLNPRLQQGCATDLPQHCSHIMLLEEDGMAEDFMEGKVIECLKDRLRKQRNSLTPHCQSKWERLFGFTGWPWKNVPWILNEAKELIDIDNIQIKSRERVVKKYFQTRACNLDTKMY